MARDIRNRWFGATWQERVVAGLLASGIIGALLQGFMVVHAATPAGDGNALSRSRESFSDDSGVVLTPNGIAKITSATAGQWDTAHGVEATRSGPQVNNALTQGHYAYRFQLWESEADSWGAGEMLTIEVYGQTETGITLLAMLFIRQGVADNLNVEGVSVVIDVGSSTVVPDSFDIIVSRD